MFLGIQDTSFLRLCDDDNAGAVGEILARAPEKEDIFFSQRTQDESL